MRMTFSTNVDRLIRKNDLRVRGFRREMEKASKKAKTVVLLSAQAHSNLDDHSLALLAKMGHPYSKRRPNPPHDPAFLHKQSGHLYDSWEVTVEIKGAGDYTLTLRNKAEYFKYMEKGTKRMIPRPILSAISSDTLTPLRNLSRTALRAAMGR